MLRRFPVLLAAAATFAVGPLSGQAVRPRSADYLFAASANDVRALWTNPAGLAVIANASVMAEFGLETPPDADVRLAQWTLAFNSRGISGGYQRDRFSGGPSTGALRLALAVPFRRGSVGFAATYYHGSPIDSVGNYGFDVGVRYRLLNRIDLGLVARNIGRPTPLSQPLPLAGALAGSVAVIPRHVSVQAEVVAAERFGDSGYDVLYRGGLQVSAGTRLPLSAFGAVDFDSGFASAQWMIGISVGGRDSAALGFSGHSGSGTARLDRVSATGVATRYFAQ